MSSNINSVNKKSEKKKSIFREYLEAIAIAVIIAMIIRSFGIEAFKIPSPSMVPTLMVGDHIFVNKFVFGLRIPLTKKRVIDFKKPKRGDVIVFMYPGDESKDYIKRVIGIPGDIIEVVDTDIFINGKKVKSRPLTVENDESNSSKLEIAGSKYYNELPYFDSWRYFLFYEESIGSNKYIVQYAKQTFHNNGIFKVPEEHYFVMGDNRDNSSDSREWGFVPFENVKGKALFVWLSWNREDTSIRLRRIGKWIK